MVFVGYIHPVTKAWHHKAFADFNEANMAMAILLKKKITCVEYRPARKELTFHGASKEEFIATFILAGGEYDIAERQNNNNPIPELLWNWIASKAINDTVVINGHMYTVEEDSFKQDEMWAEAYNSYSGYDKVFRWTVASATDEEVYVEFYTDL